MAGPDKERNRTHHSLNIDTAAGFAIQTAQSLGDDTEVAIEISEEVETLYIQPDNEVYYGFSASDTAILGTAANNLYLPSSDVPYIQRVPRGLVNPKTSIYLHLKRKAAATVGVRLAYA